MNRIIAVDFDGTCAPHEYPRVEADVPHTVEIETPESTRRENHRLDIAFRFVSSADIC